MSGSSWLKQVARAALLSTPWVIVPELTPWVAQILWVVAIATCIPPSSPLYVVLSSSVNGTSVAPWMPFFMSLSSKVMNPPVALPFLQGRI